LLFVNFGDKMKKSNILLVSETFFPDTNGVAMTLTRISLALKSEGREIIIVRPKKPKEKIGYSVNKENGLKEYLVNSLSLPNYKQIYLGFISSKKINKIIDENNISKIYIATEGPLGNSALKSAKEKQIDVYSGFHTDFERYCEDYGVKFLSKIVGNYLKDFHNKTIKTLSPSKDSDHKANQIGINNVCRMGRGVDNKLFNPNKYSNEFRSSIGATKEDLILTYVGRLAKEKNLNEVVIAFESALRVNPNIKLLFVGEGPELKSLKKRAPYAYFTGALHGEELATAYASSDIFLFPSLTETYGNVVMEAAASGLVIVSYAKAAALESLGNENALLAPIGNFSQFRLIVDKIVDKNKYEIRNKFKNNSREKSLNYPWSKALNDFKDSLDIQKYEV